MFVCLCLLCRSKCLLTVRIKAVSCPCGSFPSRVQANPARRGSNQIPLNSPLSSSTASPFMPSLSIPRSHLFLSVPISTRYVSMPLRIRSSLGLCISLFVRSYQFRFHASLYHSTSVSGRSKSHQSQLESASGLCVFILISAFSSSRQFVALPVQSWLINSRIKSLLCRFQSFLRHSDSKRFPAFSDSSSSVHAKQLNAISVPSYSPFKSVLIPAMSKQFSSPSCPIHAMSRLLSSEQIRLTALRVIAVAILCPSVSVLRSAIPLFSRSVRC